MKQNLETVDAVTHTHTHTRAFLRGQYKFNCVWR